MTPTTATERDARIRAAEQAAYGFYGRSAIEKYLPVQTGFGPVDVRMSIFEGTDDPPILLLHGISSISVVAAPLLAHLSNRTVIALDWPGHGLSAPCVLPAGLALRPHAAAVIESLLDGLGLDRVDIIGHSMGAQIGLYSALDQAPRVRRLVLLGAPGAAFAGVRPIRAMKLLAVPWLGGRLLSRAPSERVFRQSNDLTLGAGALDHVTPHVVTAMRLFADRPDNAASIASFFRALLRLGRVRRGVSLHEAELGRVQQPTLLAWGDEDVFLAPLAAARSIVAIRDARLIRVAGAGHAPWLQAPDLVGAAISQHLGQESSINR